MPSLRNQRNITGLACIFTAIAGLLGPSSLFAGNLGIQIPSVSVKPTATSSVSFSFQDVGQVTYDSLFQISPHTVQSDKGSYIVTVDANSFVRNKFNDFQFDLYVQTTATSDAERFRVIEGPIGVFTDYLAGVPITIETSTVLDTATLPGIPIHAQNEGPIFTLVSGAPFKVTLGARSRNPIPLVSNLTGLRTSISEVKVVSTSCSGCWLVQPSATTDPTVQPQGSASLNLTLQPNNFYALFASAFSLNPNQAHDVLDVYITSTPDLGGLSSQTQPPIHVPVRFWPSWYYLAFAVLLGSLIGFGIRRLLPAATPNTAAASPAPVPSQGRFPQWGRDLLLSVATAAIVEIAGLILYNPPTTAVVIFGFSLDPTQFAPSLLIAVLVAGGPPVAHKILDYIK
ncbi:MAG: hypothetical protein ABSC77_10955 [Terracidiphilus sp.]